MYQEDRENDKCFCFLIESFDLLMTDKITDGNWKYQLFPDGEPYDSTEFTRSVSWAKKLSITWWWSLIINIPDYYHNFVNYYHC